MSQVSGGNFCILNPLFDHSINLVEAVAQCGVIQNVDGDDLGKAGSQDSVICASTKQGGAPAQPRHFVTVGPWNPLDQAVQTQPAQVVCDLARGHFVRGFIQKRSPMVAQVAVSETPG